VTEQYLGVVLMDVMQVLLVTSLFACALSLHNIVVRYKFTLGRFGVLSNRLATVHPKHGSPHVSSMVLTIFATLSFIVLVLIGADPAGQIYAWGAMAGTLGYMAILSLTCLSVIVFFFKQDNKGHIWRTRIAPAGGLVGILGCLWIAIDNLPDLIGGEYATTVSTLVVLFLIATFLFGLITAQLLRTRKADRYEALRELA
jgi:amino acid transporter